MSPTFEIGMVYRKNSRLHLAVDHHTLITVHRGKFQEVKPYVKYEAIRNISVDELCIRWRVGVEALDTATKAYLAPPFPPKSAALTFEARKRQDEAADQPAQPILELAKSIGRSGASARRRLTEGPVASPSVARAS